MTQPKFHRLLGLGFARRPQLDVVDGGDALKEKEEDKLDESLAQTQLGVDHHSGDDLDAAISLAQTRAATGDVRQTEEGPEDSVKETGPVSFAATLIPSDRPTAAEEAAAKVSISALMRTMAAGDPSASLGDPEQALDVSLAQTRIAGDTGPLENDDELGGEPLSLARTLTPVDAARSRQASADSGSRASLRRDEGITDDPDLSRRLLKPQGNDGRLKDLIRARIFRKKAAPVKIGRYTILDRLGEGGMGVVYTAFDDKLERKIAIKVMRSDNTEGSNGRIRLIREAQAMARLAHPNIVTVHEVGEVDDQIFVAMEYIRGQSLDQWQQEPHPWREVVEVFRQAGRGLAAAHDAGIIHRDFKPHNVLLGEDGTAKVLDFGLARSMTQGQLTEGQGSGEDTAPESTALAPTGGKELSLLDQRLTRTGALMGTPAYMAPEQHEGRPANAHSDQFSFCVALYEGLYGELPFEATSLPTLIASVLEGRIKDPPSSAKVPSWLRKVLLRGLAVDPERRFASVSELLTELGRDPVARRRRWLATAGFATLIGGAGFGAASLSSAQPTVCTGGAEEISQVWGDEQRAAVERAIKATGVSFANATWKTAGPRLDDYAVKWARMRSEACQSHLSGKHSDRLYDLRTACLDQRRAALAGLVEVLSEANEDTVEHISDATASLPSLAKCSNAQALTTSLPPPEDPEVATRVAALRLELARARSYELAGDLTRGEALISQVEDEVQHIEYAPLSVEVVARAASIRGARGSAREADDSLSQAIWAGLAVGHDTVALEALSQRLFVRAAFLGQPVQALADKDLASALVARTSADDQTVGLLSNNLGVAYEMNASFAQAEQSFLDAIATLEDDDASPHLFAARNNLGALYLAIARYEAAVQVLTELVENASIDLGTTHPHTIVSRLNLATAHRGAGHLRQSQALLDEALADINATFPADSDYRVSASLHQAMAYIEMRSYSPALQLTSASVSGDTRNKTPVLGALLDQSTALALAGTGDFERALEFHEKSISVLRGDKEEEPSTSADALDAYGDTLRRAGRLPESESRLLEALTLREEKLPPNTPSLAITLEKLALTYIALERYDDAEAALSRAATIVAEKLPPTSQLAATVKRTTAELELVRGNPAAAVEQARAALSIHEATRDADDGELALTRFALARALDAETPASAEAKTLATTALEVLRARGEGWEPEAERVDGWLKRL